MGSMVVPASANAALPRIGAFLARVAHANPHELLMEVTRTLTTMLGERGSCLLVGGGTRVLFSTDEGEGAWGVPPLELARHPWVQAALDQGRVVTFTGGRCEPALPPPTLAACESPLPPSLTVVPLVWDDRRLGVVLVSSDRPLTHKQGQREEATLIARIAMVLVDARRAAAAAPPSTIGASASVEPAPPSTVGTAPGRRSVLIVDDDPDQVEILRVVLAEEGYVVRTAADGEACLRAVQEAPPDLVLMDVSLPGLDGTSVALRMRAEPISCASSIIFVSGSADLLPRMRHLGMADTDFLLKPYSVEQLLVRMERSFERVATQRRLQEEAHVDALTGLGNLRLLRERLATEASRLERYGTPAAVVLVDVDKLKGINDVHGHVVGSEALQAIGGVLKAEIRETDLAVRYGGDEFVVLLPHTTLTEGLAFADRVLGHIRLLRPAGISVTASLGVAARERKVKRSFESLLAHADVAVYRAKHAGGNRACSYGDTGGGEGSAARARPGGGKLAV
ncbi:MAG: diguanylate cyclase [Haliangium ochraceum]